MSDRFYAKSQSCQVELGRVRFAREWVHVLGHKGH